jgi:translation initiation factor IF-2
VVNYDDVPITKVMVLVCHLESWLPWIQRLDAENIDNCCDEFGYEVEFITVDIENIAVVEDKEDLVLERLLLP